MAGKSVLVIDTPENCAECPLRYWGIAGWSCIHTRRLLEGPIAEREEWCPLRPLPEVRDVHCHYDDWELERIKNAESRGFNWCIDEIMGEKE